MSLMNFTLQDIVGTLIAFLLFPIIYVIPGYVIGWLFNLFDFRNRLQAACFIIAIVVSISISPIITFLTWDLLSVKSTFFLLALFFIAFIIIIVKTKRISVPIEIRRIQLLALSVAAGWSILSIFSLIDIQWGNRLYYNVVSHDFTTRAAIINAITRTGVPPVNPSYFPGQPIRLTFLYYFWYIPCSLVEQLGWPFVDGRIAMIASVAWCGLGLMAIIALYLRLRNPQSGILAWKSGLLGNGLLLISGLDFIPALLLMISTRLITGSAFLDGDIEHWNEQITAWLGALSWVPHHVAAMIACITGMLLAHYARGKGFSRQLILMSIAGLAFASACGLSIYVTILFVIFWGIWLVVLFQHKEYTLSLTMAFAGVVALIAASPFLAGLVRGNGTSQVGQLPFILAIRTFQPLRYFIPSASTEIFSLASFLLLPVNYLLELGFFLIAGLLWLQEKSKGTWKRTQFHSAEIILLSVTIFICTFIRSTTIDSNDFGWRAWLPGQFILLIWSVDVIILFFPDINFHQPTTLSLVNRRVWTQLRIFLLLGLITTIVDVTVLRIWTMLVDTGIAGFPNAFSADVQLGRRTFAAREAYEFINHNTLQNIHIQQNTDEPLNIPIGLYSIRAIAISGHTAFGIPNEEFLIHADSVGKIFKTESTWNEIDQSCKANFIDMIVVNDEDPLWKHLMSLEEERHPFYQNRYYAVLTCGNTANQ